MDEFIKNEVDIYTYLAKKRKLFLIGELTAEVANKLVAYLFYLDQLSSEEEIVCYINSSGGTISDGLLAVYDTFQYIKAPISTICIGQAYSSAAILLAAGSKGKRFAYPNADIMIHTVQVSDVSGTQSELEEESKRTKKLNACLMELIASHTGQSLRKVKKDCQEDRYMSAKEALSYGIIDEIIQPFKKISEIKKK